MAAPAAVVPGNLPAHLTSFVGRDQDLRSLRDLLGTSRMVTLVGTGGAGKSRLAVEAATESRSRWPDGVWWVELAAVTDVGAAVVGALDLPGRGTPPTVAASWLAPRHALLVLDNCEHVLAACAELATRLLQACPHLSVLATSREPLGVAGESRWPVGPLPEPEAVHLFEARARLASPAFKAAPAGAATVSQICERLDRLPLAIEMAAARVDVMSEEDLLANLDDRFKLLRSGTRGTPQRQQTMTAAIDWSHRLLTEPEARLFRRLAVFRGGFALDAAQAIGTEPGDDILDLLSALVHKSMVVAERIDDGATRYRLLESHHVYATAKLEESAERPHIERRHSDYFTGWLDRAAHQKRKSRESENLWAALAWAQTGSDDRGLGLAVKLADFDFSDNARIRGVLLELLDSSPAAGGPRARAENLAARLAARQGDDRLSKSLADSSLKLARKLADHELLAYVLRGAGVVYHTRGDLDKAAEMYAEALALLEGSANEPLATEVKNSLGLLAVERNDSSGALDLLGECVAYARSRHDHAGVARYLESLANAQLAVGDAESATRGWKEALAIFDQLQDPFGSIWCMGGLALAAARASDHDRALRLGSAVERLSREWSLTTGPFRRDQLAQAVAEARVRLGDRRAQAAWDHGQAMTEQQARDYAFGSIDVVAPPASGAGPLTRREREVAAMVASGLTNKQIAERLFISERTAEGHVERIRNKLSVRSRTEVATWAVVHGLIRSDLDKPTHPSTV